jgi:hypothetical protein
VAIVVVSLIANGKFVAQIDSARFALDKTIAIRPDAKTRNNGHAAN